MNKNSVNRIVIEGYVKENTLQATSNAKGEEIISGHIIALVDENTEFRLQYYTQKYRKSNDATAPKEVSKMYADLSKVTAEKTTSFATILKSDPNANIMNVKALLTKVRLVGVMQEYLRLDKTGNFAPIISYKGINANIRDPEKPFTPSANFEVEVYVDGKKPEMKDGEETGRIIFTGLIPEYDESVSVVDFVAPDTVIEGTNIAQYMESEFNVGDTIKIAGQLTNSVRRVLVKKGEATFGQKAEDVYSTEFINERVIAGGSPHAYEDERKLMTREEVVAAKVKREEKIANLGQTATAKNTSFGNNGFGGGFNSGFNQSTSAAPKGKFAF